MEFPSLKTVRCETFPVRDANALQRRRRMMMLQNDATTMAGIADRFTSPGAAGDAVSIEPGLKTLFHDCGGRTGHQLLIEINGDAEVHTVSLDHPFVVIGRDRTCGACIRHPDVLPFHAYVQWIDGRLFCCGLGDSDAAPPITTWIGAAAVTVGTLQLSVPDLDPQLTNPSDPQARSSELAAEVPQVQLKFPGVEQRDNLWPVDRTLTLIGRGAQCKLRLDHSDMPTVLAALIRTPASCWLINLTNDESLQVNRNPTVAESLDIGDRLQLGAFEAEVRSALLRQKKQVPKVEPAAPSAGVKELATRHRKRLGALTKSLETVQYYLDGDHLDAIPELKSALQQYVLRAQRHHREMQEALEQLANK